ncbi:MAG: hypothetical protein AAGE52_08455 [Myxococcota bacterium]
MKRTIVVLGFALACGGSSESSNEETQATSGSEQASIALAERDPTTSGVRPRDESSYPTPPGDWEAMSLEERGQYMGQVVLPYFREIFQEYDGERYASFGCQTCHGANMNERNFAMPNPDILPLHDSGTPEQRQMVEDHPTMVRFMFNHVVPAARSAVGGDPYDAETGEGFGCYDCHTHAERSSPAAK